jgi:hypothetical protein
MVQVLSFDLFVTFAIIIILIILVLILIILGKALIDHAGVGDSLPVFLKLLVKNPSMLLKHMIRYWLTF